MVDKNLDPWLRNRGTSDSYTCTQTCQSRSLGHPLRPQQYYDSLQEAESSYAGQWFIVHYLLPLYTISLSMENVVNLAACRQSLQIMNYSQSACSTLNVALSKIIRA